VVICLERDADLHTTQLMLLPLTVSYFSEIQIGFTLLVPARPGSPGKRAVKRVCVVLILGCNGSRRVMEKCGYLSRDITRVGSVYRMIGYDMIC